MKIELAHICYDVQTIELPEKCPGCGGPLSEATTVRYYYTETTIYGDEPEQPPKPDHKDLLLMVQCYVEDCHEILAHADPASTEVFHSLQLIGCEIGNFLSPRVMTGPGEES
jgi:hypothetical protein